MKMHGPKNKIRLFIVLADIDIVAIFVCRLFWFPLSGVTWLCFPVAGNSLILF